jgi:hypothetical protein
VQVISQIFEFAGKKYLRYFPEYLELFAVLQNFYLFISLFRTKTFNHVLRNPGMEIAAPFVC